MGCDCSLDSDKSDSDDIFEEGDGLQHHSSDTSDDDIVAMEGLIEPEPIANIFNQDDKFKTYTEIAQNEQQHRASQVDASTDIFSRMDIKLLPDVEGNFGRINNEESGEYIITYWSRMCDENLFVPIVICNLIVKYIDMVYRSRWHNRYKGPDFKINVLDKCKASIPNKYGMKQGIRAVNCCLRDKVSIFYITVHMIDVRSSQVFNSMNTTNNNFIGIVSEHEHVFNIDLPTTEGYGVVWQQNVVYKKNKQVAEGKKPSIRLGQRVKCVVDLRDGYYLFKCLWKNSETVIRLPQLDEYKDIKWYPYVSGALSNTSCIIEFDAFTAKNEISDKNEQA